MNMRTAALLFTLPLFTAAPVLAQNAPDPVQYSAALGTAPVSYEKAKAARAAVKYEKTDGANSVVTHRFTFPDGQVVEFPDQPRRPRDQAKRERVVFFVGSERAQMEPDGTFEAAGRSAGLSPEAILALRFVSRHEGGFDAINTWDRARFSWGFIQFAGGYGLRPAMGHFKAGSPALFQSLMADYGIDVLPSTTGGNPEPVYLNCDTGQTLRGNDAEQAFGDNPLAIALFIRAGRVTEVKQRQVEAAVRDYASPALRAQFEGTPILDILRSPQAIAMLIDRQVHEGNISRLVSALEHARAQADPPNPANLASLEATVLDLALRDSEARIVIAEQAEAAAAAVEKAAEALKAGADAAPSLASAREALGKALYEVDYRLVISPRRDALRTGLAPEQIALDPTRIPSLAPEAQTTELTACAGRIRAAIASYKFEGSIRNRLRSIRTSDLPGPR